MDYSQKVKELMEANYAHSPYDIFKFNICRELQQYEPKLIAKKHLFDRNVNEGFARLPQKYVDELIGKTDKDNFMLSKEFSEYVRGRLSQFTKGIVQLMEVEPQANETKPQQQKKAKNKEVRQKESSRDERASSQSSQDEAAQQRVTRSRLGKKIEEQKGKSKSKGKGIPKSKSKNK